MKATLVMLAGLFAAGQAAAQAFDAPPKVSMAADPADKSAGVLHASLDIAAPPSAVWAALTDCADAPRYMPGLISCKILKKGPGYEVREHRLKGSIFKPVMRNVFRAEMKPNESLSFHRIDGDWKRSEGVWRLSAIPGGTHVTYEMHAAVSGPVPAGLVRGAVAKAEPKSLIALRQEAVRRAGKR